MFHHPSQEQTAGEAPGQPQPWASGISLGMGVGQGQGQAGLLAPEWAQLGRTHGRAGLRELEPSPAAALLCQGLTQGPGHWAGLWGTRGRAETLGPAGDPCTPTPTWDLLRTGLLCIKPGYMGQARKQEKKMCPKKPLLPQRERAAGPWVLVSPSPNGRRARRARASSPESSQALLSRGTNPRTFLTPLLH